MEAVILAGGFGVRLQSVVADVPKPMAPVQGRPFLSWVLDDMARQGMRQVVLAVGYKHEVIEAYFGRTYQGMKVLYSREDEPLGTGGALKKALQFCREPYVFAVNGDTYFAVDYAAMLRQSRETGAGLTIAVKEMRNFDRYGALRLEQGRIRAFCEKQPVACGYINGGVYCLQPALLDSMQPAQFSFETDFAEKACDRLNIRAFFSSGYFIDIGIPADYERAQQGLGGIGE